MTVEIGISMKILLTYVIPDSILLHLAKTNVPYGLLLDPTPAEGKASLIDT